MLDLDLAKQSLKSLKSLLDQTFQNFKLIISDNASTDLTQKICEDYAKKDSRIHYIKQEKNLGLVPNWNLILKNATTKYFMYAAVDDIWDPHFVKKNFDVLESDENIVGSIGKVTFDLDFKNKQNIENHSIYPDLVLNMSGTYEDRIKSCLKLNQATPLYAIYRTAKLQKSMVVHEDPVYDLQMILNILDFGKNRNFRRAKPVNMALIKLKKMLFSLKKIDTNSKNPRSKIRFFGSGRIIILVGPL